MEILDTLPPAVTLVLALLLVVWLVLALLVPFMIESIRNSTRRSYAELEALNDKMDRLVAALEQRGVLPAEAPEATNDDVHEDQDQDEDEIEIEPLHEPPPKAVPFERRRKEPTI